MDGRNTEWLAHMIFARLSLAEVELALGRPDAPRDHLGRAAGDTAKLLSTDCTRNKWNIALSGSRLLRRLAMAEAPAPMRQDLDAFMSAVQASVSAGKSLDAEQTRIASAVELALGARRPAGARCATRCGAQPLAGRCRTRASSRSQRRTVGADLARTGAAAAG